MNNPSVIPAFNFHDMVQPKGEEVITTSRKVAEYFGKRHGDVLRKIEQVKADCSVDFSQRNFASADYIDEQGKLRPMVSLTKDGWIMCRSKALKRLRAKKAQGEESIWQHQIGRPSNRLTGLVRCQ